MYAYATKVLRNLAVANGADMMALYPDQISTSRTTILQNDRKEILHVVPDR